MRFIENAGKRPRVRFVFDFNSPGARTPYMEVFVNFNVKGQGLKFGWARFSFENDENDIYKIASIKR